MEDLFYLYGFVEIFYLGYNVYHYYKDYEKPNEVIELINPIDALNKINKFDFTLSIFGFLWMVIGLFTKYTFSFLTLLILLFAFMFYKNPEKKSPKIIILIESSIKVFIIISIMLNHFFNHV